MEKAQVSRRASVKSKQLQKDKMLKVSFAILKISLGPVVANLPLASMSG